MRPARYTVTGANTPVIVQVDYRSDFIGIVANPDGGGNFDIEFSRSLLNDDNITPIWAPIEVGGTTLFAGGANAVTGIRITLNSGDGVDVDITASLDY